MLKVEPSSLSLEKKSIELVDVPFYPQAEYQCGPAALATLLKYRGKDILPDELISLVYTPQKQGSLQVDMVAAVRQQGVMPYPLAGNMQALLTEVSAGNPVLILQNLGFNWVPVWHYAVVMGYDVERNELILRSGETERWLTTLTTFERTWRRAEYWGLVIVEANQIPPTANPLDWLKTAFDLEQTGQADKALIAYRTGFQSWPESVGLGMALGNLLYAKAEYSASSKVFQQLSLSHPLEAQVWNNWAYVLKARSCEYAALQAARCANTIAPHNSIYQSTLNDMQTLINQDQLSCPVETCRIGKNYED